MKFAIRQAISILAMLCSFAPWWHAAASDECKNHYILSAPCIPPGLPALETAIGVTGAVTTAPDGSVYFSSENIVYRLDPASGFLDRVAGDGNPGYAGDDGPAAGARLSFSFSYPEAEYDPMDFPELVGALAVAPDGALYIGDAYNNRVRKVDRAGTISTVIAPRDSPAVWPQGLAVDAASNLFVAYAYGLVTRISPDGGEAVLAGPNCGRSYAQAGVCAPEGIAVDRSGAVYVPDGYCRVRRIEPGGSMATIAGLDTRPERGSAFTCGRQGEGVPATEASLQISYAVAVGPAGDLFVADTYNNCIRRIDADGIISTFAGICRQSYGWPGPYASYGGGSGFFGDGGPALAALLSRPHGVAADALGNVYIADSLNRRVRKVDRDGIITTVAGNGE